MESQAHTWYTEDIRDISVQTEDDYDTIVVDISAWPKNFTEAKEDYTITCVEYINNKRVYTRPFTLPKGKKSIGIGFSTNEGGTASYAIDNKLIK